MGRLNRRLRKSGTWLVSSSALATCAIASMPMTAGKIWFPWKQCSFRYGSVSAGNLRIGYQLNAGIVQPHIFQETQERQFRMAKAKRRQIACSRCNDAGSRRSVPGKQFRQIAESLIQRQRRDSLLLQRFQNAQTLAHSHAGPDRPFQIQTTASRMLTLPLFYFQPEPFIGEPVMRLHPATQSFQ